MAVNFGEQARSLLENDAFLKALTDIRANALDGLVAVHATDADSIRQFQATVRVVDDIRQSLKFQKDSAKAKPPGIA